MRLRRAYLYSSPLSLSIVCAPATAAPDLSFDYTSFGSTFGQSQLDVLNYRGINGRYMMTSGDNHRPEMVANGNTLAEFYNWLTDTYSDQAVKNGAAAADTINTYTLNNAANNGPRPDWIILNEISVSLWPPNAGPPSNSTYRTWLLDCVTRLHDYYGYNVVTLAPWQNPGGNSESWQALAEKSYIGVECYLSGTEIWNSGSTNAARLAWAQSQYQASKNTYVVSRGVPEDRVFLIEHFANNDTTYTDSQGNVLPTGWGRAGLASASDWDQVIMIRQDAIKAVGFDGFLAYNWGGNGMNVSLDEQIQHEYWYRTRLVLAGQQPQWLPDNTYTVNGTSIPLSWNQQLNWLGGIPNAAGAVANFYKTNTAARTVTLDGSKTVGTLSFNSSSSYTINPGTGGSLTLSDAAGAILSVPLGTHTIAVPIVVASNTTIDIATTLSMSAGFSTTAATTINRNGGGTLTISGTQSHVAGAIFNANAGTTNFNSDAGGNLTLNASATVNLNASQKLNGLTVASGKTVTLAAGGTKVINADSVSSAGKLDLKDNKLIVRSGTLGVWNNGTYTGIIGLVRSGRNGGAWNGSGIVTTMSSAVAPNRLTTLAVATAGSVGKTTFGGQTVSGGNVLVMYTYAGDANLSGTVDADDYFQIDSNYNEPASLLSYASGDFNYDGTINGDDYFLIDSSYSAHGPPIAASVAAVPEPAHLAIGALALLARRRRTRSTSR